MRVRLNPVALASMGLSTEDVRTAIANSQRGRPGRGIRRQRARHCHRHQRAAATASRNTTPSSCAAPTDRWCGCHRWPRSLPGVRNSRAAGWFNRQPSVILIITKQATANVIETVDRIHELLPELKRWISPAIDISVVTDRTQTIRASVRDMQLTLVATVILVMLVVFLFLRRTAATVAAGVTVPLSLAGTCAGDVARRLLDRQPLADGAGGLGRLRGRRRHRHDRELLPQPRERHVAIPRRHRGRAPDRLHRALDQHLAGRGLHSALVHERHCRPRVPRILGDARLRDRGLDGGLAFGDADDLRLFRAQAAEPRCHLARPAGRAASCRVMVRGYARSLAAVLDHRAPHAAGDGRNHGAHRHPLRADAERLFPAGRYRADLSAARRPRPTSRSRRCTTCSRRRRRSCCADPAVAAIGSSIGSSGWSLRSIAARCSSASSRSPSAGAPVPQTVIARLREKTADIPGLRLFFFAMQDVRVGGRQSNSTYQFTLWDTDYNELVSWAPRVQAAIQKVPGLVDVSTDREQGGLQVNVSIDRTAASRLGVRVQDIDNALNNASAQRQISTIYTQRNQYRVILEIDPAYQRDPGDLDRIYVAGANDTQVPLSAVTKIAQGLSPLVVNHQGQFPAITISFNLDQNVPIQEATRRVDQAVAELHMPDSLHAEFAGDARAFRQSIGGAAAADRRGADRGLYRARRALREPRPSADHHLHAAVGRPRRAVGAAGVQHRAHADRLHRHHPADRHRQEERHHDGRLRARGRARSGGCPRSRRSSRPASSASVRS